MKLKAIRLDPSFADAYNNRGIAYDKLGQYERAIQDYDEAIRLDPQYTNAYYNRGDTYQAMGKSEEAERDLAKARKLGYPLSYVAPRGSVMLGEVEPLTPRSLMSSCFS